MDSEPTPPHTVLVLDDSPDIRELVEICLSDEGYEVLSARDPDEALRLVTECPVGLILFDLSLAGSSGEEFVQAYRNLPGAGAQMIVLSGASNLEATVERIGADGYLTKPFELDDLLTTVERAIP
jgi:DNA-binding response OmpR family regulator